MPFREGSYPRGLARRADGILGRARWQKASDADAGRSDPEPNLAINGTPRRAQRTASGRGEKKDSTPGPIPCCPAAIGQEIWLVLLGTSAG